MRNLTVNDLREGEVLMGVGIRDRDTGESWVEQVVLGPKVPPQFRIGAARTSGIQSAFRAHLAVTGVFEIGVKP